MISIKHTFRLFNLIESLFKVSIFICIIAYGYDFIQAKIITITKSEAFYIKFVKFLGQMLFYNFTVIAGMVIVFPSFNCDKQTVKTMESTQTEQEQFSDSPEDYYDRNIGISNKGNVTQHLKSPFFQKYPFDKRVGCHSAIATNALHFDSRQVLTSIKRFRVSPNSSQRLCNLGGLTELKDLLERWIIKPYSSSYNTPQNIVKSKSKCSLPFPVEPYRSILLIGESGTGKTSIVQAIYNEILFRRKTQLKFYKIEGSRCIGSLICFGVTFRDLFYNGQKEDGISLILIENIDRLHNRAVSVLLSELDSVPKGKMIVFATSTKKFKLHERILTEDPFDLIYELTLPDIAQRQEILRVHFEKRGYLIRNEYILELAEKTSSFSGRELEKIVCMVHSKVQSKSTRSYRNDKMLDSLNVKKSSLEFLQKNKKEITRQDLLQVYDEYRQNQCSTFSEK